jgi:hypothetical protein
VGVTEPPPWATPSPNRGSFDHFYFTFGSDRTTSKGYGVVEPPPDRPWSRPSIFFVQKVFSNFFFKAFKFFEVFFFSFNFLFRDVDVNFRQFLDEN